MPLLLIAYVVTLAGLTALTFWSHRGRRIDDHPLCCRCHFDLIAKPPSSTRCPE